MLGAKAPLPTLDSAVFAHDHTDKVARDGSTPLTADWDIGNGRKLKLQRIDARDGGGVAIYDDGGNLVGFFADGGYFGIRTDSPTELLHVLDDAAELIKIAVENQSDASASAVGVALDLLSDAAALGFIVSGSNRTGTTFGLSNASLAALRTQSGKPVSALAIGTGTTAPVYFAVNDLIRLALTTSGIGMGVNSPQGPLHAHDGTGGILFATKTGDHRHGADDHRQRLRGHHPGARLSRRRLRRQHRRCGPRRSLSRRASGLRHR